MAFFQGTVNDTSRKHHLFTTIDANFEAVGLQQFTLNSLYRYAKDNHEEIKDVKLSSSVKDFLLSAASTKTQTEFVNSFLGLISETYYYKFDLPTIKYTKQDLSKQQMLDLINNFEILKTRENFNDRDTLSAVREIQNSAYNYLTIKLTTGSTVGTNFIPTILNLYFNDDIDKFSGKRELAQKTSNLYIGVPKTATGLEWGFNNTVGAEGQENSVGVYAAPSEGGVDNPTNPIAAEVDFRLDHNTGKWQAGTHQILAKLITNIEKPSIKNVVVQPTDTATDKNFYDIASDYYMGGFTTGMAMPLSVEKGNPHLFGPNCIRCTGGEQRIEKIRVINRAPRTFKAGATVLCSQINGEWIIQDFGYSPDDVVTKSKIGSWSFIKLIANSDAYFKDDRFKFETTTTKYNTSYLPSLYESTMRTRFYSHLLGFAGGDGNGVPGVETPDAKEIFKSFFTQKSSFYKLCNYNVWPAISGKQIDEKPKVHYIKSEADAYDFRPSTEYFISTIFDQLGQHMGGSCPENFIQRTNTSNIEKDIDNRHAAALFPFFWGPVFPDGYRIADVTRIEGYGADPENLLNFKTNNLYYFSTDGEVNPFAKSSAFLNGVDFFSLDKISAKELPAEVAVLSSGNPIEDMQAIMFYNPKDNYAKFTSDMLKDTDERFAYLLDSDNQSVYNMTPINANKIQFTCLHADFAGHADRYSKHAKINDRRFFENTRGLLKPEYSDRNHFWGRMFNRGFAPEINNDPAFPTCAAYKQTETTSYKFYNVPYDCYIKNTPTNKPLGSPLLFKSTSEPEAFNGANLIGIIAAKNKFTKTGGGVINYSIDQVFGLRGLYVGGGSQITIDTMPPSVGGGAGVYVSKTDGISKYEPSWGSSNSDRYDTFGTTALHVRVFDAWPTEQTVYDARYFSVLHFNPGELFSLPVSSSGGLSPTELTKKFGDKYTNWENIDPNTRLAPSTFNYQRYVDQEKYKNIDFRVPTYAWPKPGGNDNVPVPVGTDIDKNTLLRPITEGRINPIRRGQLLTGGGFRYFKNVIGLSYTDAKIIKAGLGFVNNETYTINSPKGIIKIKVATGTDGAITEFEFDTDEDNNEMRGTDFLPADFSMVEKIDGKELTGYFLKLNNAQQAEIYFPKGRVYEITAKDEGPQERSGNAPKKLTSSSGDGKFAIETTISTSVEIAPNKDGQYDAFYFFHNDITHAPMFGQSDTTGAGYEQYITMTIT
jgi:hypothetical protein